MTTPCNLSQQLSGPFNQTLFLGCTVVNMDMNLGWGGETSSCRLTLIKDLYEHHASPRMNIFKDILATKENNSALNNENINNNENRDLPYHQNILLKEKAKWDKIKNIDINNASDFRKDIGKHCWRTYISNIPTKYDSPDNPALLRYRGKDPGFIGDFTNNNATADLDIIGCPVFFRFADVWFGGMIKNWKFNNSKYEVELNSLSSLLKGCQLILQKYYGTISTVINNTNTALETSQNLAVPYVDLYYPCGESNACRESSVWPKYNNRYNGSVYQGNIPNVFNVFGYLENSGFGNSGFVEGRGVSAGKVYDAIIDMLEPKINRVTFAENVFNPYGAIVGKTPFNRTNNTLFNPHTTIYTDFATGEQLRLTEMGLINAPTAVDGLPRSLFALDISSVPRPPDQVYLSEDRMDLITFIDFCCTNAGVDFLVEFIPNDINLNDFYSGTIKIKTITRNVQPKPNTIRSFILNSVDQQNVVSYNFGEEYQDVKTRSILIGGPQERLHQVTTHTGGQMGWWRIFEPSLDSWVSIESYAKDETQNGALLYNTYRAPDHANQRPINGGDPYIAIGGAAVAQENRQFNISQTSVYGSNNINKGSYLSTIRPILNNNRILPGNSYPLYLDLISPYFGKSNNKQYRRVYLDRKTGQLQIVIDFRDIQTLFPTQYDINDGAWGTMAQTAQNLFPGISLAGNQGDIPGGSVGYGKFVVEEDELRAALINQETWEGHRITCINWGRPTAISKILYNYLSRTISPLFAEAHIGIQSVNKASYATYVNTIDRFYGAHTLWWRGLYGWQSNGLTPFAYAFLRPELNIAQYNSVMPVVSKLFEGIWSFLKDIGDNHYGKTFAVRLPQLVEYTQNDSGEKVFNYTIVGDAWEEPGNTIDDTMETDSLAALSLKTENGKIPPLLAFDNSAEYDIPNNLFNSVRRDPGGSLLPNFLSPYAHRNRTLAAISLKHPLQLGGTGNRYYHPLIHNLPADSYLMLPYIGLLNAAPPGGRIFYSPIVNTSTAHNFDRNPESHLYKLYTKAQVISVQENSPNPQIIFVDNTPRVVLSTPSPVFITSLFDSGMSAILAEILIGDEEPAETDLLNYPVPRRFSQNLERYLINTQFFDTDMVGPMTPTGSGRNVHLRAAKPVFAAIPLRYNLATYGPWVSHPGLIASTIFPGQASSANEFAALVNNLVGGVNVEIDTGLVPWEYGGMAALDAAALLRAQLNNEYQQVLETGDITLAGIMLRNAHLGSYLLNTLGPIVTSLKINIGDNGITTQYGLRSFSRKLGFYNKEQADNIQKNSRAIILQNRRFAEVIKDVQRRLIAFASRTPGATRPF